MNMSGTNHEREHRLQAQRDRLLAVLKDGVKQVCRAHRRQDCYCALCMWSGDAENVIAQVEAEEI